MALHITKSDFEAEVLHSEQPVLVDFWASWCGPCRMFSPTVDAVADDYAGVVKVCKVNVDEESELAANYRVASIPTLLLFKNGQVAARKIGAISKEEIVAMFE